MMNDIDWSKLLKPWIWWGLVISYNIPNLTFKDPSQSLLLTMIDNIFKDYNEINN